MKLILVLFFFVFYADGAYEGDICDKAGVTGTCTKLSKCPAAIEGIKNRNPPQNCGFSPTEPIVCCIPTTTPQAGLTTTKRPQITSTTTEYVPPHYDYVDVGDKTADGCEPIPPSLTSKKTGQKAWDKCLEYQERLVFPCNRSVALGGGLSRTNRCHHNADELIVGGTDAGLYEFPHMALLGFGDSVASLKWECGGSLISENFVLTAGHCTASRDSGNVTHVVVGNLKRTDDISGRKRFKIKNVIKHPEYKPPHKYNDIALLELETSVPLDEFTVPACLHTGDAIDDSRASATGWGLTEYRGGTSDVLQKVILTKFETQECARKYTANRLMLNGFDVNSQTCYGDRSKSKDTCQGDSGGPLQVKNKKIACMYTVVGVTSFGKACGFIGEPGIYTRVANYLDWIERTVWP